MFNQKTILVGIVLALILAIALEFVFGPWGGYIGIFLAGVIGATYGLENDYKRSAFTGAIIGFSVAILFIVLLFIIAVGNGEPIGLYLTGGGILTVLFTIVIFTGLVAAGSALGIFVKKLVKRENPLNPDV